jgi:hypothetical protein
MIIEIAQPDQTVEVGVDKIEPGGRAPVTKQPRLDVLPLQWLAQQRIIEQVDLTDRQIVCCLPIPVEQSILASVFAGRWSM